MYKIVTTTTVKEMESQITQLMQKGFFPAGNLQIMEAADVDTAEPNVGNVFLQTMVLPVKPPVQKPVTPTTTPPPSLQENGIRRLQKSPVKASKKAASKSKANK